MVFVIFILWFKLSKCFIASFTSPIFLLLVIVAVNIKSVCVSAIHETLNLINSFLNRFKWGLFNSLSCFSVYPIFGASQLLVSPASIE